jgi:ribosomal protein S18 acetylase RimI-like enzyme
MDIRAASDIDLPALIEMIRDFFAWEHIPFEGAELEPALRKLLCSGDLGHAWLLEIDGETVGYAIVTFGFDLEFNGRDAFLTDLYLKPTWRDRGLGQRALSLIVNQAKHAGVHALHLLVDPTNERARRLYERSGFEPSHRVAMTKRLV